MAAGREKRSPPAATGHRERKPRCHGSARRPGWPACRGSLTGCWRGAESERATPRGIGALGKRSALLPTARGRCLAPPPHGQEPRAHRDEHSRGHPSRRPPGGPAALSGRGLTGAGLHPWTEGCPAAGSTEDAPRRHGRLRPQNTRGHGKETAGPQIRAQMRAAGATDATRAAHCTLTTHPRRTARSIRTHTQHARPTPHALHTHPDPGPLPRGVFEFPPLSARHEDTPSSVLGWKGAPVRQRSTRRQPPEEDRGR